MNPEDPIGVSPEALAGNPAPQPTPKTAVNDQQQKAQAEAVVELLKIKPNNSEAQAAFNIFAQATQPLFNGMMKQSMGRLLGEMPTDSDKKIMYRLLEYLPEKSKAMSHAVMANVAKSIAGDQQAGAIAAKFLEEKNTFDTKNQALQFGIMKLADPNTSPATQGSIMAGLRNYWDDIYGPDKSVKMTQAIGFMAQVGSVFEALLNKATLASQGGQGYGTKVYNGGGDRYGKSEDDELTKLSKLANDATSRYGNYTETRLKAMTESQKDKKNYEDMVKTIENDPMAKDLWTGMNIAKNTWRKKYIEIYGVEPSDYGTTTVSSSTQLGL